MAKTITCKIDYYSRPFSVAKPILNLKRIA